MILVLPLGSVSLLLLATILDLDIEWNVLMMSMSSMSYQAMLWVLCVTDSPLDRDHDLDLECLPLLGWWHLSGLLPWVCVLSLWHPLSWLTFDLQHELKWFLLPHLWHFLPNAGQSLYACVDVTFTTHVYWCYIYWCYLCANCLLHLSCHFYCPSYHIWNFWLHW